MEKIPGKCVVSERRQFLSLYNEKQICNNFVSESKSIKEVAMTAYLFGRGKKCDLIAKKLRELQYTVERSNQPLFCDCKIQLSIDGRILFDDAAERCLVQVSEKSLHAVS